MSWAFERDANASPAELADFAAVLGSRAVADDRRAHTGTLWHWPGILRFALKHPERLKAL
jgi:hypothetical protein